MSHIFYLIIIVLTGLGSSIATYYAPQMIARIKRLKTRKNRIKPLSLTRRVEALEMIINMREKSMRTKIQKEVNNYLEKLRND